MISPSGIGIDILAVLAAVWVTGTRVFISDVDMAAAFYVQFSEVRVKGIGLRRMVHDAG